MVWIRSGTTRSARVRAELADVRALLTDVVRAGVLMPGVRELTALGDGGYHYRLDPIDNGAVRLEPDYETAFDLTDPAAITWAPRGEHNFRSWGTFRSGPATVAGEVVIEIETRSEAAVDIAPVMVTLVEPFAQKEMEEVTEGFLAALAASVAVPAGAGVAS